jgi:hypothetical protein
MEVKINLEFFLAILDNIEKKLCLQTLSLPKENEYDFRLYKDEYSYNTIDILKEYNKEIIVNEKTEYIYLHRSCLTKYDISQRKKEFYENFKVVNKSVKENLKNSFSVNFLNAGINEMISFKNKTDFEKFCKEIIDDTIYTNKFILKVL